MSKWYSVSCASCGADIHAHEDWERPPKYCADCKAKNSAAWHEIACESCGTAVRVHRDWEKPPRFCTTCKAERDAQWKEISCEGCGRMVRVRRDWDHPPRFCQSCKAKRDAEWYEKSCEGCGVAIRVRKDWEKPPRYCTSCKSKNDAQWYERKCEACSTTFRARRDWEKPPTYCKSCLEDTPAKQVACAQCGNYFEVSTKTQLRCRVNHWDLPRVCHQCKEDALLIRGAVGALRDQFPFPLETTIEKESSLLTAFLSTGKVAVVRNKKTGEIVARVRMEKGGLLHTERIAVAEDIRGQQLSETHEGGRKFFTGKRIADTYSRGSSEPTHRSRSGKSGLFRKPVVETERIGAHASQSAGNVVTQIVKGLFGRHAVSDKDKQ